MPNVMPPLHQEQKFKPELTGIWFMYQLGKEILQFMVKKNL